MSSNSTNDNGKKEESIIQNIRTQQTRPFFGSKNSYFKNIIIDGIYPEDSAFNESNNITIEDTYIILKYCLYNCNNVCLFKTILDVNSRSSIWYCENIELVNCKLNSVKACRNCSNLTLKDCIINSDNFGWKCQGIRIINCKMSGVALFLGSSTASVEGSEFNTDYIFQYSDNIKILDSTIVSRDTFWNSKNIYCKNCKFTGEFLCWYSENCVFENCHIDGDMPICYSKKIKLINCTMANCLWGFEYSDIEADIKGHVGSIRSVLSGKIVVDSLGEYVQEGQVRECKGVIEIRSKEEEKEKK
jgi:hypothetical protein